MSVSVPVPVCVPMSASVCASVTVITRRAFLSVKAPIILESEQKKKLT